MKLSIKERLLFPQLYPAKASLTDQILVKDVRKKVELTQKDITEYEVKSTPQTITWNPNKVKSKNVTFTDAELDFLKKQIEAKDKENAITQEILDLCIKIKNEKIN